MHTEVTNTQYLDAVDTVVVSHTLTDPGWRNTAVVRDPLAAIRELRERAGGDIVVTGSISCATRCCVIPGRSARTGRDP